DLPPLRPTPPSRQQQIAHHSLILRSAGIQEQRYERWGSPARVQLLGPVGNTSGRYLAGLPCIDGVSIPPLAGNEHGVHPRAGVQFVLRGRAPNQSPTWRHSLPWRRRVLLRGECAPSFRPLSPRRDLLTA